MAPWEKVEEPIKSAKICSMIIKIGTKSFEGQNQTQHADKKSFCVPFTKANTLLFNYKENKTDNIFQIFLVHKIQELTGLPSSMNPSSPHFMQT